MIGGLIATMQPIRDASYASVLAKAVSLGYTLPSSAQQRKHVTLVRALKAAGVWSKLDVFYLFANNGSKEFATLNWINPNANQATIVNSMGWTSNQGFKSNGSTSYLETNYNISTGTNYTQNNASRGAWIYASSTGGLHNVLGAGTSSRDSMVNDGASTANRINQSTTGTTAMANFGNTGLLALNRTASNALTHYAATTSYSRTTASAAIVSDTIHVGKVNTTYGTPEIALLYMGASLVSEHTDLYNALNTYMSAP